MEKCQTIGDRILEYLQTKGINRNQLCKANNWDPSKINRQLKGESGLSADTILGFVTTFPDVNLTWLMLGVGPMIQPESPAPVVPPVSVRADKVAPTTSAPDLAVNDTFTPAELPGIPPAFHSYNSAELTAMIANQQEIINRQAKMLENLINKFNNSQLI